MKDLLVATALISLLRFILFLTLLFDDLYTHQSTNCLYFQAISYIRLIIQLQDNFPCIMQCLNINNTMLFYGFNLNC